MYKVSKYKLITNNKDYKKKFYTAKTILGLEICKDIVFYYWTQLF